MSSTNHDEIVKKFLDSQSELVLQASDLSLSTVSEMVTSGSIDVDPKYQRRRRWNATRQSQLIESLLLNVPIPPVYLAEDDFGTYSIIDGKQRLTAINDFMTGKLRLRGAQRFEEINGLRFRQLPRPLKNALTVRPYIRAITLLRQTDPALKYEVFLRLNIGGQPLNAQEIRNVAFRGSYNDMVYECSDNKFLRQQLKITGENSTNYRKMVDAEWVLRFLMLADNWKKFSGDFRTAMDDHMRKRIRASDSTTKAQAARFEAAIAGCESLWGTRAFQRPEGKGWRSQALAGMYDAQMLAVDAVPSTAIKSAAKRSRELVKRTRALFDNEDFEDAVRQATNTPAKIRERVVRVRDVVVDVAAGQ